MRGAGILSRLAAQGRDVARNGTGVLLETYPAAALEVAWGLPHNAYKGRAKRQSLSESGNAQLRAAPLLDLGAVPGVARDSDDVFDASICASVARAAVLGQVSAPPAGSERRARQRGWDVSTGEPPCADIRLADPTPRGAVRHLRP